MKKLLALLLALCLVLALCACGSKSEAKKQETQTASSKVLEDRFTEIPQYILPEGASTDEIRSMAVKAMQDELSVPWYVPETINYGKSGAGNDRTFTLDSKETYCGLPYTNANNGLFHWLQYYNFETGEISGINTGNINNDLGNSCAASVMWGWSAVCTSIKWNTCVTMIPKNGAIPVGFNYSKDIKNIEEHDTKTVCNENGVQGMFKCYAQMKPADALLSAVANESGDHAMMAVLDPVVEYLPDGTIDGKKSFIMVQDQRMGHTEEGDTYIKADEYGRRHYAGRVGAMLTFQYLFDKYYIPFTAAEFIGQKPYTVPAAVCEGADSVDSYKKLLTLNVKSDYKIITLNLTVTDSKGKEVITEKSITLRKDTESGKNHNYPIKNVFKSTVEKAMKSGNKYNFKVDALISNGQTFTVVDKELTYK